MAGYHRGSRFSGNGCICAHGFMRTLEALSVIPQRFICVDSLDVFNPVRRSGCTPVDRHSATVPGATCKIDGLGSRRCLRSLGSFPAIVFHPAKICNPHRHSCFLVTGSVGRRVSFTPNFGERSLAFVCIESLMRTICLTVRRKIQRHTCFIDSKGICSDHAFSSLVRGRLNGP